MLTASFARPCALNCIFAQSQDCALMLRNLEIAQISCTILRLARSFRIPRMRSAISRLCKFLNCTEHIYCTNPASLYAFSEHDNYRQPLLPDHPPEVSSGVGQGAWKVNVIMRSVHRYQLVVVICNQGRRQLFWSGSTATAEGSA